MRELVAKAGIPFYKHQVLHSCVLIIRSSSAPKSLLIKQEDLPDFKTLVQILKDLAAKHPKSDWVVLGTEGWIDRISGIVKSLPLDGELKTKVLQNRDVIMLDAKSGKVKVQQLREPSDTTVLKLERTVSAIGSAKSRVLVVDDSPTMLKILDYILSQESSLEVVGLVETAEEALSFVEEKQVDVITLDLNLPEMHGVEFLKECKRRNINIPTIVITSMNLNDGDKVFEALQSGAVDYIQKPDASQLDAAKQNIIDKVKGAATANLSNAKVAEVAAHSGPVSYEGSDIDLVPVFVGSSTGGTTALERMFLKMKAPIPPIVIVQHIPPMFSKAFADRLNSILPFEVKEAEDGDEVKVNRVLIAPGGLQMGIRPWNPGGAIRVSVQDSMPVNRFKPSVDYLFESVAINYSGPKLAMILTGMGRDGAQGMKSMKETSESILTIAQDKDSSVVFGMPKVAIDLGCVDSVCHLDEIPQKIRESLQKFKSKQRKSA
ncbi:MAG: chemotaxis-specific protein-glutamate methyltransferase CheB [Bdellovibrionales bacterium]|nr:chemotaxis-specific protein-glutamate methyltransferase CheB [Bdellovibrionales bacterium]